MFRWTDDMIRYMADAGRQTDFHRRLTAELLPYLSPRMIVSATQAAVWDFSRWRWRPMSAM